MGGLTTGWRAEVAFEGGMAFLPACWSDFPEDATREAEALAEERGWVVRNIFVHRVESNGMDKRV
jgi:hypothetical protein